MKSSVSLQNEKLIMKRLQASIELTMPGSPKMREMYHRIGMLIATETSLNIKRAPLIDTGNLLNSIQYKVSENGVEIGSYGVPYAAFHEFGFHGTVKIMQHMRLQTKAFGKVVNPPRLVGVRGHSRLVNYKGKPFLRPALIRHTKKIYSIINEYLGVNP